MSLQSPSYSRYAQRIMTDKNLLHDPTDRDAIEDAAEEYADLLALPDGGEKRLREEMESMTVDRPPVASSDELFSAEG